MMIAFDSSIPLSFTSWDTVGCGVDPMDQRVDQARTSWDEPTAKLDDDEPAPVDYQQESIESDVLERGSQVGRYSVLEPIGEGGMGVVYKAWDPQLDRTVALKVLRNNRARGGMPGGAELLAEAQTLAKLEHPNIVTIYDAGFTSRRVFIAMALCEGQTLGQHLAKGEHSVREILELFIAAGRGLAAAHQTGVVHRDFKPSNVLLGKDDSVRVADFGMARLVEFAIDEGMPSVDTVDATWQDPDHDRSVSTIVGTPLYMAPEQLEGRLGDHRMDQFSFCLCLYTALLGRSPFPGGKSFQERRRIVPLGLADAEREMLNRSRRVPVRVRRALLRGLSIDPEQRFASMDALLAELVERRRWPWAITGVALAVGLGLGAAAGLGSREQPCDDVDDALVETWSVERAQQLGDAILETRHPDALGHRKRVVDELDAYAEGWKTARADACRATYIDQEQSEAMFDRRMQCLQRRRSRLEAAVEMLAGANGKASLDRRMPVAFELPSIAECNDTEAMMSSIPLPNDDVLRQRVEQVQQRIDMVDTMRLAGSFEEGLVLAHEVVDQARTLDYEPVQAQALESMGRLQTDASTHDKAEASLREAIALASRNGDDRLAARSWASLVYVVALQGDGQATSELHFAAQVAIDRADDDMARAWLFNSLGVLYSEREEYELAHEFLMRSLRLKINLQGPQSFDVGISWINLGFALACDQRWQQASDAFQQGQGIFEHTVGPGHPYNDVARSGLCKIAVQNERFDAGRRLCRGALTRLEESSASPALIARVRLFLARALYRQGHQDEALEQARRAIDEVRPTAPEYAEDIETWTHDMNAKFELTPEPEPEPAPEPAPPSDPLVRTEITDTGAVLVP